MEIIRGLGNLLPRHRGCVATIGTFDGLHIGHQAVLDQVCIKSQELGLPSVVIIFEPLPGEYLSPKNAPARLMSFREKIKALKKYSIDRVLCIRFDDRLRSMSAQKFIDRIFVDGLGVKFVVFGDDFRFGNDREGDLLFVQKAGEVNNFRAMPTLTVLQDSKRISSSRIREALHVGDLNLAKNLLGRPYSMEGKVVYGRQLGRTLGAPTANIELRRLSCPLSGVYAVKVRGVGINNLMGVANVGIRPTVNDTIKPNLEVHLLDFNRDIYGCRIEVIFLSKIREEKKFSSLDQLKANIAKDQRAARDWFDTNPIRN